RGADRLAPADVAGWSGPSDLGRHLCLASGWASRADEDRRDRARGAGSGGRAGVADADGPASGALARKRPVRRLRQGDAAYSGPARARNALRADQRGNDHRPDAAIAQELSRAAADSLSDSVEVPR